MSQALALLKEHPQVELLRRLDDLPLIRMLQRPGWHVLCDAPMAAALSDLGLPGERMTQALESGAFLSDSFVLPCAPNATVVIATRRSEEAVAGVLRTRGQRPVLLFSQLLPRLVALVPPGVQPEALRDKPTFTRRLAILSMPWSAGAILAREIERLTGAAPVALPARSLVALAEARGVSGFEVGSWWRMLTRANTGAQGHFALRWSWPELADFLSRGQNQRGWLEDRLKQFHIVQVRSDPLLSATAQEFAAAPRGVAIDGPAAIASALRRRDDLVAAGEALAGWVREIGARTTVLESESVGRDPTGAASQVAAAARLPVKQALAPAEPERLPQPVGPRFDRLLTAVRAAAKE